MTDDREDKTLEKQEHFIEIAKSRDVEVLSNRHQFLEFAGNLVPVTKSGDQLSVYFLPFQENRLAFMIKVGERFLKRNQFICSYAHKMKNKQQELDALRSCENREFAQTVCLHNNQSALCPSLCPITPDTHLRCPLLAKHPPLWPLAIRRLSPGTTISRLPSVCRKLCVKSERIGNA
jgi:hypothetical protein